MVVMKTLISRSCIFLFAVCFLLSLVTVSRAGNKAMVEKSTRELDELNKQAVQQIPNLPKDGTVELKANAKYKEGELQFDIYHQKVYDEKETIAEPDKGDDSPGNGTAKEKPVENGNNKDTSREGEKSKNDSEDY